MFKSIILKLPFLFPFGPPVAYMASSFLQDWKIRTSSPLLNRILLTHTRYIEFLKKTAGLYQVGSSMSNKQPCIPTSHKALAGIRLVTPTACVNPEACRPLPSGSQAGPRIPAKTGYMTYGSDDPGLKTESGLAEITSLLTELNRKLDNNTAVVNDMMTKIDDILKRVTSLEASTPKMVAGHSSHVHKTKHSSVPYT